MNLANSESEPTSKPKLLPQIANIFVSPSQALDYARQKPGSWWLPLGILLVLNAIFSFWWALTVNLNAFHLEQMRILTRMNPEHAQQFGHYIMHQGRGGLIFGVAIGLVVLVIIELIFALYLFLADKLLSSDNSGYGQWFSFTNWTSLPAALGFIAGIVAFAVSKHPSVQPTDVTSLNTLFFHFKPWDHLYKVAQFSILNFWVIGLVTYGLKRWRNHSTGKALAIALAPYVVVYLIMYLV